VSAALLDVNVLIALFWPGHRFHTAVIQWFGQNSRKGWATCPLTQFGFVRLYAQPQIVGAEVSVQEALHVLEENARSRDHTFWSMDTSTAELLPEMRERLVGHQQLTDAILLDLAIRKNGRFVTLDRRAAHLLPLDSPHRAAIEIIPTE